MIDDNVNLRACNEYIVIIMILHFTIIKTCEIMNNANKALKRAKYSMSYESYWKAKGPRGIERVRRMMERKKARYDKRKANLKYKSQYCRS